MTVKVYSGQALVEMRVFITEEQAIKYAAYWQDNGFKVRIEDTDGDV